MSTDRDNIIRLAREAGFDVHYPGIPGRRDDPAVFGRCTSDMLGKFAEAAIADFLQRTGQYVTNDATRAAVVAEAVAAEREACALVAEDDDHEVRGRGYYDQLGDARATVNNIAAAIRARSTP